MATPPAASPSPPRPPPPPPHHDTTLTLALALSPRPLHRVRSSPTGDTPPCTECGKRFTSWKALFGHMRCHPERQWRGITPPPHFRQARDQFTVQEREIAKSLLMIAGARPGCGKGKKSVPGSSGANKESCSPTPASSPAAASGQALGGSHWEKACAEGMVIAAPSNCSALATSSGVAAAASMLDLNLPPPGTTPALPWKSDQDGSLNPALDLKLGY